MSRRRPIPGVRQFGTTLVELVISIAVISVAVAGVLVVMNRTISTSSDPVVESQAIAIAEAYMEEILLQAFTNPEGGETGGPELLEGETRTTYDDISDYNGLTDAGARDQAGNAINGLGAYTVNVVVTNVALGVIPAGNSKQITVTVTTPIGRSVRLSSYRTSS